MKASRASARLEFNVLSWVLYRKKKVVGKLLGAKWEYKCIKNELNLSTAIFDKRPTVQCWSAPWNILSFKPADPSSDIFKGYSEGVPASPVQLPAGSQWSASRECAPCTAINQPQQNIQEFETSTFCKNNHFMDMSHLILLSPLLDVYSRAAWKLTCQTSVQHWNKNMIVDEYLICCCSNLFQVQTFIYSPPVSLWGPLLSKPR